MPVIGDPAGMRAAAAQLRYRAERFSTLAGDVDRNVEGMAFVGPAADRWRAQVDDHSARLRAGSARLESAADSLLREAAAVEIAQQQELAGGGS